MQLLQQNQIAELESKLQYKFNNVNLLNEALSHPSLIALEDGPKFDYDRLEFLGDAVLGLVIAELLYNKFKNSEEGWLANSRAKLVSQEGLCKVATKLDLAKYLLMTYGEEHSGGRSNKRNIENAMEAVIAAIYLDGGLDAVKRVVANLWEALVSDPDTYKPDIKSALQEWAQKHKLPIPTYHLISNSGSSHEPHFNIEVLVKGYLPVAGGGRTKKEAEKEAATRFMAINNCQ